MEDRMSTTGREAHIALTEAERGAAFEQMRRRQGDNILHDRLIATGALSDPARVLPRRPYVVDFLGAIGLVIAVGGIGALLFGLSR